MESRNISVRDVEIGNDLPLVLIAGPCQLETRDHALFMAKNIYGACEYTNTKIIFKASYDKANRSSITKERGVGIDEGLRILESVRDEFGCPILTDVHNESQCVAVGEVVDIIQIPAFLCRQTDLLLAAGSTGKVVNVKKGQFMAPWDMVNVISKIEASGNNQIMLCERGTSFGYNTLVSDFRSIPIMAENGVPIVFDATHSVQQPGGRGTSSGGQREFVPPLAQAACAIGVAAVFIETHEAPDTAPSDGPNMLNVRSLQVLVEKLSKLDAVAKEL